MSLAVPLEKHRAASLPPPAQKVAALEPELSKLMPGRVSRVDHDRLVYARDMWPLGILWARQGMTPQPPDLVCWPKDEAELTALVQLARREKFPLIPYGAGSGVCGGTWATHGGVMVDLKHFDQMDPVDAEARTVFAGAGVMGETLERRLESQGYTLGHFPSSIYMSTVGGWLAARSAGQLSSRYGKIEDMALSVRFVTGGGEVVVTPQRPFSGPDLNPLLIGTEGTCGFFTGATLRVFPAPTGRAFRGFECGSVEHGLEGIRQLFRAGLKPAVVRLYDPFDTAFVGKPKPAHKGKAPSFQTPLERDVVPSMLRFAASQVLGRPKLLNLTSRLFTRSRLIVMFEGEAVRVASEMAEAQRVMQRLGATDLGEEPGKQWYVKRYDVSYRMSKVIDSGAFADTMEVAAPWEKVHQVYERVRAAASPYAFVLCHFSHAYLEGCSLYFSFVGSGEDEDETQRRYHALWRAALSAAVGAGANVSHHHGIGLLKADVFQQSLGEARHALKALKDHFDPDGVMNPGKLGL